MPKPYEGMRFLAIECNCRAIVFQGIIMPQPIENKRSLKITAQGYCGNPAEEVIMRRNSVDEIGF
ncbi:hypothetical protein [Pleurocapsa sp. PCC 7327]|uniref:hypothetical protein n=1 Tax=Pleurocapsa sp. PCC 7327 TaxID=118163 RepID=UPI0011854FAE|nr:hypothetical protein [Pleurocapsa sp. PCC 7327]